MFNATLHWVSTEEAPPYIVVYGGRRTGGTSTPSYVRFKRLRFLHNTALFTVISPPEFLILGVNPSFNMPLFGTKGLTRIPKLNTEVCRKHVGHKQEIQTSHAKFLSAQTSGKCVKVRYVIVDNYWPYAAQCYAKTKLLVNSDDI